MVFGKKGSGNFNPQGPHGPRPKRLKYRSSNRLFQSTRPSRASTWQYPSPDCCSRISIHKALTGLDKGHVEALKFLDISIHKALTGLDLIMSTTEQNRQISIHKALTGLDGNFHQFLPAFLQFSKHNASFFSFNSPPYPKSPYFLCPLSRFFKCEYSNLSMSTSHPH